MAAVPRPVRQPAKHPALTFGCVDLQSRLNGSIPAAATPSSIGFRRACSYFRFASNLPLPSRKDKAGAK